MSLIKICVLIGGLCLASSASGEALCGSDDCPAGFQMLYCRKFTNVTTKWTNQPLRSIKFEHQMCMVNNGGPINVKGDLTYFFRVKNVPVGKEVLVTSKCEVTLHSLGRDAKVYDNGSGATFGPYTSNAKAAADWYIVQPQLDYAERQLFSSGFPNAVDIDCALEFESQSRQPPARGGAPEGGLVGSYSCTPGPCQ